MLTDDRSTAADVAYGWNKRNRKSTVTVGGTLAATYLYNAEGQRVSKVAGAVTTHYIYDFAGSLIAEANGATGATTREFIWLPAGAGVTLPLAQVEPSSTFWYVLSDHQGSPQKLANAAKAIVWDRTQQPFGEQQTVTGTATTPIRFPGQYADAEDGNAYNYFRDYDPTLDRYLQPDPIGQAGGLNVYKYAESNPLRWSDPRGLWPWENCGADDYMGDRYFNDNQSSESPQPRVEANDQVYHGNDHRSRRPTEVYYLINRKSDEIDKIGITSNLKGGRYSKSYLALENVEYYSQVEYGSRFPATMDEKARLFKYFIENGKLPRLNKVFR